MARIPALIFFCLFGLVLAGCMGGDRIESIESELRSVRKQVSKMKEEQEAQKALLESIGKEMGQVRKVAAEVNADSDSLSAAVEGLAERLNETNGRIDKLSAKVGASVPANGPGTTPGSGMPGVSASAAGSLPPSQLYDQAMGDYTKGNYALAVLQFREFLSGYPDNDLADNAQYGIAESYFAQKKYEDAIREYDKIFARHPASEKVPEAYLKKGFAFLELAQTAQGVVQLQYLIEKYPKSDEAQVARRRLESMGLRPR